MSVVVYDVDDTKAFRSSVAGDYDRALAMLDGMAASANHCDCATATTYLRTAMSKGLTVLYRAARFGRMKHEQHHSGWECWQIAETEAAQNRDNAAAGQ